MGWLRLYITTEGQSERKFADDVLRAKCPHFNEWVSRLELKAKDVDFFISDWLRNRNTVEFLGIWERVHNPAFNYGEFAAIKSQAGLNSYKISVKEWVEKPCS
jgi:hypothetical protein